MVRSKQRSIAVEKLTNLDNLLKVFEFKTKKRMWIRRKGKNASFVSSEFTISLKKQDAVLSEFLEIECTHIILNVPDWPRPPKHGIERGFLPDEIKGWRTDVLKITQEKVKIEWIERI